MSHSVAWLSFQIEIYFKRGATRILRSVAYRHPISRGLAFSYYVFKTLENILQLKKTFMSRKINKNTWLCKFMPICVKLIATFDRLCIPLVQQTGWTN
jgi:hypothetical protein